jgi:flavin-dependent dehydrogenase
VAVPSYDVIVAGGGPGGSTVAAKLARAGVRVLVLEKERFPRFHLGESLLPMSLTVFDDLGVTPKLDACLIRKYGARFVKGDSGEEVTFKFNNAVRTGPPFAFHGPRAEIDRILLDHAAELGAEVRQGWTVHKLLSEGERTVGVTASGPSSGSMRRSWSTRPGAMRSRPSGPAPRSRRRGSSERSPCSRISTDVSAFPERTRGTSGSSS